MVQIGGHNRIGPSCKTANQSPSEEHGSIVKVCCKPRWRLEVRDASLTFNVGTEARNALRPASLNCIASGLCGKQKMPALLGDRIQKQVSQDPQPY